MGEGTRRVSKRTLPLGEKLLWSADEVAAVCGISRSILYDKLVKDDSFPRPRRIERRRLWLADDVRAWVRTLPMSEAS